MQLRHADTEDELRACFPHAPAAAASGRPGRFHRARAPHGGPALSPLGAWRGDEPLALAGYRLDENLIYGSFLYVDDLVTHESSRGRNLGARLLDALTESARRAGCAKLVLDTGSSNALAQRFYFRQGLLTSAMRFSSPWNRRRRDEPHSASGLQPEARGSESARLSRAIVDRLVRQHPGARVIGRPLRQGTIAHVDGDYARALAPQGRPPTWRGSLADSEILIRELESADCLVIGTPMHNYTVPSALRPGSTMWCAPTGPSRTSPPASWACWRTPVYVAVSSGGSFASEPARQPDFLTPYLTAILNTIGLRTIHFGPARGGGGDTLAHARSRAQAELERHFAAVHA